MLEIKRKILNFEKWKAAVLLISIIPLLPEYFAPLMAIGAFALTYIDIKSKNRKLSTGTTGRIILVYITYISIGLIYSSDFISTLHTLLMYLVMFLIYLSVYNGISGREKLDFLILGIGISAGLSGLISLIQYLSYVFLKTETTYIWDNIDNIIYRFIPIQIITVNPSGRMSSTFNNPNIFAEFMVMAFPFAVYYSYIGLNKKFSKISVAGIFLIAFGVAFSFSRSGYTALIFIMAFYAISKIRKYTMAITMALSALLITQRPVVERFFSIPDIDTSTEKRLDIWINSIEIIKKHPVFGNGAGVENTWNLLEKSGINTPHMHNLFLQIMAEGGIAGLIIFTAIIWQILKTALILTQDESYAHIVGVTIIAFLTGFTATGLTDYPLMTPKLVGMFLLLAGITDVSAKIYLVKQPADYLSGLGKYVINLKILELDSKE